MKQANKKFDEDLHPHLLEIGYNRCVHDECLFVRVTEHGFSIISTHVDDILQVSTSDALIEELRFHLIEKYKSVEYHENADACVPWYDTHTFS
jgi:hypothetical protein